MEDRSPRLAVLVTSPLTARYLLRGQLAYLRAEGFEVFLLAGAGPDLERAAEREGVEAVGLPLGREIAPLRDLRALAGIFRALRRIGPDVVQAGTPKAGLLGLLAAALLRVPVRVYHLRGLRLETVAGWRRRLLAAGERLAAACAHRVICVGPSLERRFLDLGLAPAGKTAVLGPGSSNGVDTGRFFADPESAAELRRRLGIPASAPVLGFVGRFTRDKGIADLAEAYLRVVLPGHPSARLLLVGDFEPGDPVAGETRARLAAEPRVVWAGFVEDAAPYYRLMDVLLFPSYREGFPNAPLEAAASEVPTVGYEVTGSRDAVVDGETGTLVAAGSWRALGEAAAAYLADPGRRREHGRAARRRALEQFRCEAVWGRWAEEYRRLLAASSSASGGRRGR